MVPAVTWCIYRTVVSICTTPHQSDTLRVAIFGLLTAVLLNFEAVWDVMFLCWVCTSGRFERSKVFVFKVKQSKLFYVLLAVHPRTFSQIIQLDAQFCLNIYLFIYFLYMFRASKCPSSGENHCIHAPLGGVWSDLGGVWSSDQTPPIQRNKYQCRIDTVIFS